MVGLIGAAEPSYAATTYSTSSAYTEGWTIRSTVLHKCARVTVSGYIKGSWRYLYNNGDINDLRWTNLRLVNPQVSVSSWGYTTTGCDSSKHWSDAPTIQQAWYETTCSVDVFRNVSFGIPWSISASLAPPSCGSHEAGNRKSNQRATTGESTQSNAGTPIDFSDTDATVGPRRGHPDGGLDFGGTISVTLSATNGTETRTHSIHVNLNK
jgi:hypothetical protein